MTGLTFLGPYEALLFDMDGTILTSTAAVVRAWSAWSRRVGAPVGEVLEVMHGRRAVDTIRAFARPGMDIAAEVAWLDGFELQDVDGIEPISGATEFLEALPKRRWAVVTSANRAIARRRMAAAGLPLPECLIASDDVGQGKPSPEGYLRAAGLLGADPKRCAVFEDAAAGVQAGLSAGADVLLIAGQGTHMQLPVKAILQSYAGLAVKALDQTLSLSLSIPQSAN